MRCGGQRACNNHSHRWPGVPMALASAMLFGASTPLSKLLLGAGGRLSVARLRKLYCEGRYARGPTAGLRAEPDNGRNHGAAMLNNPSIEYFPAPVMHNSKKPPIMQRFL